MDRSIPKTKRIGEVKTVDDLNEREHAYCESDLVYTIRHIDGKELTGQLVMHVFRTANRLWAHTNLGADYPISGEDAYVIKAYGKKYYKAKIEKKAGNPMGYIPKPH